MDKKREAYLGIWYILLEDICQGLRTQGWKEHGGSECFRTLSKGKGKKGFSAKVYLNDYEEPTGIVVRYS